MLDPYLDFVTVLEQQLGRAPVLSRAHGLACDNTDAMIAGCRLDEADVDIFRFADHLSSKLHGMNAVFTPSDSTCLGGFLVS